MFRKASQQERLKTLLTRMNLRSTKPIGFCGSSREDLAAFPRTARRNVGYQLQKVQEGDGPADWKPMTGIGPGVREIRIREANGTFRVIYVASFADAVYVLHCFQKKTRKTRDEDIEIARKRFASLMREQRK